MSQNAFIAASNGEYGGKLIVGNATTTPDVPTGATAGSWNMIIALNDIEISALVGPGCNWSGTRILKAGSWIVGTFTSVTTTATGVATAAAWGVNRRPL